MNLINEKLRNKQVWVLFIILFTDMIGFGMAIPLFGLLFGSETNPFYLGNVIGTAQVALYFGIFSGLYGLGQFFSNPVLGALSDNIGRKPVLSFAIFGTFISRVLFVIGLLKMNIFIMFFSRFLDGATGGIISLSNASITDTTTSEERSKFIGKTMAGFSLGGFVAGPIIFTLFSYSGQYYSVVAPFVLACVLSLIAFIACLLYFPETLDKDKIHKAPSVKVLYGEVLKTLLNLKNIFEHKHVKPFFIASGIFYFAFAGFNTFSSQYLFSAYKLSSTMTGVYFLIAGVVMTVMQGFLAYKVVKKYPYRNSASYLGLLLGLTMLTFTFSFLTPYPIVFLFINAALFALFVSLNMVYMQTEISKIRTESKGAMLGAFSSLQVLAMALAPVAVGLIAKYNVELPFIIGAILIIISGVLFQKSLKNAI